MTITYTLMAAWMAGASIATTTWVIGQISDLDFERWVGGGIMVGVAVYMVRWALRVSSRNEESTLIALKVSNERADQADVRNRELRLELVELTTKYEIERRLRMELELLGCKDHRHNPRDIGAEE